MKTSSRFWIYLCLFWALLAVSAQAQVTLTNGGFEDGTTGWELPANAANWYIDTTPADTHGGVNNLAAWHAATPPMYPATIAQTLLGTVEAGKLYTLDFWIKTGYWGGSQPPYPKHEGKLLMDGVVVATTGVVEEGTAYDHVWTHYTLTFLATGAQAGKAARVEFSFDDNGATNFSHHLDDVSLSASSPALSLVNGGFEDGTTGWELPANAANWYIDTTPADTHGGVNNLAAWHTAAPPMYPATIAQDLQGTVEAGKLYTLDFWVKTGYWGGSQPPYPKHEGKLLIDGVAVATTGVVEEGTAYDHVWTHYTLTFLATGAEAGKAGRVEFSFDDNGATNFSHHLDDFSLSASSPGLSLTNGSFEDGATGWTGVDSPGGTPNAFYIEDDAAWDHDTGTKHPSTWFDGTVTTPVSFYQDLTGSLAAGKFYTFDAWVNWDFWGACDATKVSYEINVLVDGTVVATLPTQITAAMDGTWFKQQIVYTAQAADVDKTVRIEFVFKNTGTQDYRFTVDDVSLSISDTPPGLSVTNGGFEDGTTGWDLPDNAANWYIDSTPADTHGGVNNLAAWHAATPPKYPATIAQDLQGSVETGKYYTLDFWLETGYWGGSQPPYPKHEGKLLIDGLVVVTTGLVQEGPTYDHVWTHYTLTFLATAAQVGKAARLEFSFDDNGATNFSHHLDDIALTGSNQAPNPLDRFTDCNSPSSAAPIDDIWDAVFGEGLAFDGLGNLVFTNNNTASDLMVRLDLGLAPNESSSFTISGEMTSMDWATNLGSPDQWFHLAQVIDFENWSVSPPERHLFSLSLRKSDGEEYLYFAGSAVTDAISVDGPFTYPLTFKLQWDAVNWKISAWYGQNGEEPTTLIGELLGYDWTDFSGRYVRIGSWVGGIGNLPDDVGKLNWYKIEPFTPETPPPPPPHTAAQMWSLYE